MAYDDNKPIRIWVGSWGLYSEGYLAGDWFSLPMDRDELWAGIDKACHVTPHNEEVGCFDYECDIHGVTQEMSEYMSIDGVNALAAAIEQMDAGMDEAFETWITTQCNLSMFEIASAAMDAESIPFFGYDFDGYGAVFDGYCPTDAMSAEEKYGRTLAYMNGLTKKLEELDCESYFDYKHYGSDDYDVELSDNGYLLKDGSGPDTGLYKSSLDILMETGYYKPIVKEVA